MSVKVNIIIFCFLIVIVTFTIHTQDQAQPANKEVTCGVNEVHFPCEYNGSNERPKWRINGSNLISSNELSENYRFNGTHLIVENVTPELNNTRYQCVVELVSGIQRVPYESTEGTLIIKCGAPHVKCTPIYHNNFTHNEQSSLSLKAIFINVTQEISYNVSYIITYSELNSRKVCHSSTVPAICNDGKCRCNDTFEVRAGSALCSTSLHLTVTVTVSNNDTNGYFSTTYMCTPIDAINRIVQVEPKITYSGSEIEFGINCTLLNIPWFFNTNVICEVLYTTDQQCENVLLEDSSAAILSAGSHSVVIGLDSYSYPSYNLPKVCFTVIVNASRSGNMVKVEGEYDLQLLARYKAFPGDTTTVSVSTLKSVAVLSSSDKTIIILSLSIVYLNNLMTAKT